MILIVGILVGGIGTFIQEKVQEVLTFWQIIWLTLPLTVAVAILAYRIFAKQAITLSVFLSTVIGTFVASVVTGATAGTQVADALFKPHVDLACLRDNTCSTPDPITGGPFGFVARLLGGYLQVYGGIGVLKAVVVGTFIAYGLYEMTRDRAPGRSLKTR